MKDNPMSVIFKNDNDGFGFKYGFVDIGEDSQVRIDVMPPEPIWRGTMRLADSKLPDPRLWAVFVDGEEIGRVATEAEVKTLITAKVDGLRKFGNARDR